MDFLELPSRDCPQRVLASLTGRRGAFDDN
jgi:hypothetical protein